MSWRSMFALKRVAVRALSQQPLRQLSTSTFRPQTTRVPVSSKPAILRSFHQSRLWLAEEKAGETATTDAATQPGSSSAAVDAVSEASGTTAEPIDSPHDINAHDSGPALNTSSNDANAMPSATSGVEASEMPRAEETTTQQHSESQDESLKDKARDAASSAADTVQDATASAAASARSAFDQTASKLQSKSAEFPPRTPAPTAASSSTNSATSFLRSSAPKNKILYIGNLFFEVSAQQLEAEFARFGTVTNARVVSDQRGLSKGFGYVEFSDQSGADKAVKELDQKVFQGRRMAVQYHVQRDRQQGRNDRPAGGMARGGERFDRPANPPSKTLFIGNMSYQMSDRDLNDLFREIRNVLDVRVAIDRRSGQPRGFAHADFIDVESAEKAKEYLEKKVIYGRTLKIDYSAQNNSGMRRDGGDAE
ncbi:hypothetical protein LTS14_010449 [Recurvomyces mirabilis]|uniref:uncharacterized protein n=1 Tax=Recurvomyces mirabilis TaxID=574656 RepID=UPI002DDFC213|nr:hypothetical protein LTS14_010449 [Recurvomyces mirabilis]